MWGCTLKHCLTKLFFSYRVTGNIVALKEIRLNSAEGTPFTAIREGTSNVVKEFLTIFFKSDILNTQNTNRLMHPHTHAVHTHTRTHTHTLHTQRKRGEYLYISQTEVLSLINYIGSSSTFLIDVITIHDQLHSQWHYITILHKVTQLCTNRTCFP